MLATGMERAVIVHIFTGDASKYSQSFDCFKFVNNRVLLHNNYASRILEYAKKK